PQSGGCSPPSRSSLRPRCSQPTAGLPANCSTTTPCEAWTTQTSGCSDAQQAPAQQTPTSATPPQLGAARVETDHELGHVPRARRARRAGAEAVHLPRLLQPDPGGHGPRGGLAGDPRPRVQLGTRGAPSLAQALLEVAAVSLNSTTV